MTKLIILLLTLLPVLSYSQVTSINVDTSIHQVIIINNGTMIENNGGTVNVVSKKRNDDSVEVIKLKTPNEMERAVMDDDCKVHSLDECIYKDNGTDTSKYAVTALIIAFILWIIIFVLIIQTKSTDKSLYVLLNGVFGIPILYIFVYLSIAALNL